MQKKSDSEIQSDGDFSEWCSWPARLVWRRIGRRQGNGKAARKNGSASLAFPRLLWYPNGEFKVHLTVSLHFTRRWKWHHLSQRIPLSNYLMVPFDRYSYVLSQAFWPNWFKGFGEKLKCSSSKDRYSLPWWRISNLKLPCGFSSKNPLIQACLNIFHYYVNSRLTINIFWLNSSKLLLKPTLIAVSFVLNNRGCISVICSLKSSLKVEKER